MKIMRVLMVAFLGFMAVLFPVSAAAAEEIHGEMGETYRTVKLYIPESLSEQIYYLALPQGSRHPSNEEIIAYINGKTLAGLADGSVVRGSLTHNGTGEYNLKGTEGLKPLRGEQGFIGGMRYDIHLVPADAAAMASGYVVNDVMAQPFMRMGPNGEFYIQTAQQLASIQGLACLYMDTQGSQGSLDFLSCPRKRYVLEADIDLPAGWTPIGDVGSNPAFVFKGSFNGRGHTVTGLAIEKAANVAGLFGKLEGANISNLTLAGAYMQVEAHDVAAGLLAGEAVGGTIKNVSIENGSISITGPGSGPLEKGAEHGAIGGLLGRGTGMRLANIRVGVTIAQQDSEKTSTENCKKSPANVLLAVTTVSVDELTPSQETGHQAIGGMAGHLSNCTVERSYTNVHINAYTATAGGVVGLAADTKFYYSGTDGGCITAKNAAGGFAGRLEGMGLVLECHSHAHVTGGTAGGLVGQVSGSPLSANANHRLQILQSTATGKTVSLGGIAGGFVGEGAYVLIKDSSAYGDVESHAGAGGFVGRLSNRSRVIHAYAKGDVLFDGVSGFAGGIVGELTNGASVELSYASGYVIADSGMTEDGGILLQTGADIVVGWETTGGKMPPLQTEIIAVGGFVGIISLEGAPNTLTHCLSFAPWVVGPKGGYVHRFAGHAEHNGVNSCYAHLGSMVVRGGSLAHALPSAYGSDGADISHSQVEDLAMRLGWKRPVPH